MFLFYIGSTLGYFAKIVQECNAECAQQAGAEISLSYPI